MEKEFDINSAKEVNGFDINSAREIKEDYITVYNPATGHIINTKYNDPHKITYNDFVTAGRRDRSEFVGMEDIGNVKLSINDNVEEKLKKYDKGTLPVISQTVQIIKGGLGNITSLIADNLRFLKQQTLEYGVNKVLDMSGITETYKEYEPEDWFNSAIDKEISDMKKANQQFLENIGLAKTENDGMWYDIGGAIGSVGATIALKQFTLPLYLFSSQQNLYEETLENTGDRERAKKVSWSIAALTNAVEYMGNAQLLKGLKANKVLASIVNGAVSEGEEEVLQSVIENVGMKQLGGRETTTRQILEEATYAGFLGMIGGAVGGGIGNLFENTEKKLIENGLSPEEAKRKVNDIKEALSDEDTQNELINFLHRENDNTTWEGGNVFEAAKHFKEKISRITPDMFKEIQNIETDIEREEYNKIRNQYKETLKNILTEEQAEAELNILDRIITNGALTFGEEPMSRVKFLKGNALNLEYVNRAQDNTLFQSAAMYKAPQENINEFVDDVLKGDLEKKKYFEYRTNNDITVEIASDTINHDLKRHNLKSNEWEDILYSLDNILDAKENYRTNYFGNNNILLLTQGKNNKYNIVITQNNNRNKITTAFIPNDKKAGLLSPEPSLNSSLTSTTSTGSISGLDKIINKLKSKVNTQNETYYQAINNNLNLNQEVNILSIKNLLKDNKNTTKADAKKVIEEIANNGEQIETLSEPWVMDILNSNKKKSHLLNSNKYGKFKPNEYYRHNIELNNLKDIINNSVLIERVDNIKTDKKPDVEEYFYFYTPITDGKNIYLVKSVAEKLKGEKDLKNVHLYDMFDYQIKMTLPEAKFKSSPKPGSSSLSDALTIKDILQNVKDFYGNNAYDSYIAENQDILQQSKPIIKGQYSASDNLITLFETADPSTFLHETMHWWEQTIRYYSKNGSQEAQKHLDLLSEYVGAKDNVWNREQKELLARSFERYLSEGIAPISKLKETFEKIKEWFKNIFKSFKNDLNTDLKNYFDTLLSGKDINTLKLEQEANKLENDIQKDIDILHQKGYTQEEINNIIEDKYKERLDRIRNELKLEDNNLGEDYYKELNNVNYNVKTKSHKVMDWAYDVFINTDQQIKDISEDVYYRLKKFEADLNYNRNKYLNIVDEFNRKMIDISKKNMSDFKALDASLKNGDITKIKELLNKYDMNKEYLDIREMLDEIRDEAIGVGIDVGYIKNYFPRQLNPKTKEDFLEMLRSNKDTQEIYNEIEYNIKQLQREGRMPYSDEDTYRIEFLNNYLRGYLPKNLLPLTAYSNLRKSRKINILKPEYMPYYKYSTDSLRDYVFNAVSNIEQRKFLGQDTTYLKDIRKKFKLKERQLKTLQETEAGKIKKNEITRLETRKKIQEISLNNLNKLKNKTNEQKEVINNLNKQIRYLDNNIKFFGKIKPETIKKIRLKEVKNKIDNLQNIIDTTDTNLENSIGEFLNDLLKDAKISVKDFNLLKRNLFNTLQPAMTGSFTRFMSSSSTVTFLNNVITTLKQLLDTTMSMYKNGFFNTMGALYDMATHKGITAKKLGIDKDIAAFTRQDGIAKFAENTLKLTFFDKIDIFSKNINVNASLRKLKQDIKNNNAVVNKEIEMIFEDKAEEVKRNILNEKVNEDVLAYVFIKLSEVQPITMSSRTPFFLQNGNIRWAYIFKQYILKQLSLFKNDIYNNFRKGNTKEALSNLLRLQFFVTMGDLSMLGVKELFKTIFDIEDDEEDDNKIADTLLNSILIFKIFNLYNVKQLMRGQVKEAMLYNQITPPIFSVADNVAKDIKKAVEGDLDISNSKAIKNLPYGRDIQNLMEILNDNQIK